MQIVIDVSQTPLSIQQTGNIAALILANVECDNVIICPFTQRALHLTPWNYQAEMQDQMCLRAQISIL